MKRVKGTGKGKAFVYGQAKGQQKDSKGTAKGHKGKGIGTGLTMQTSHIVQFQHQLQKHICISQSFTATTLFSCLSMQTALPSLYSRLCMLQAMLPCDV